MFFLCWAYTLFPENFKLATIFTFLIIFLLNFINKNIFLTTFIVYIVNLLFLEPGKYFSFLMIEGKGLAFEPLRDVGLIDAYGFTVSDLLALFLSLFIFRKTAHFLLFNKKIHIYWYDKVVVISFLIYFLISFYSSRFFSFDFFFSFIHLIQYSKMLLSYVFISYLIRGNKKGRKIISYIILGLVLFNFTLSFGQFILGIFSIGSSNQEVFSYHLPEEDSLFIRPFGAFLHSNQLGFMITTWIASLLILDNLKKNFKNAILILSGILLILTQSRTVWILLFSIVIYYFIVFFKKKLLKLSSLKISKRHAYLFFVILFLAIIVGQRLISSRFSFDGGSAGIRLRMYKDGLAALSESYLFGFGPATNVKTIYELIPKSYVTDFPYAVHNGYLQMSLESGIIATFFFFFPFLLFFLINLGNKKNWLSSYLIISILVYYVFQPYAGRIEFPFLGMFLAFICTSKKNDQKN